MTKAPQSSFIWGEKNRGFVFLTEPFVDFFDSHIIIGCIIKHVVSKLGSNSILLNHLGNSISDIVSSMGPFEFRKSYEDFTYFIIMINPVMYPHVTWKKTEATRKICGTRQKTMEL